LPEIKEVSDIWTFDKDGKVYDNKMKKEDLRKWHFLTVYKPLLSVGGGGYHIWLSSAN